ncbi:hypothetical protein LWI29_013478 [Acer saccharum]|uniref:SAC domain-containing protein n=1 Tax=Acer saccharum TaxID=4024 RepID=A0AA39VYU1_ACESA|nr:hypothetical protein LWI29_013478 [Acer saccharum]
MSKTITSEEDIDQLKSELASFASTLGLNSSSSSGFNDSDFRKTGTIKRNNEKKPAFENTQNPKSKNQNKNNKKKHIDQNSTEPQKLTENGRSHFEQEPRKKTEKSKQKPVPKPPVLSLASGGGGANHDKFKKLPKLPLVKASNVGVWYVDAEELEKRVCGGVEERKKRVVVNFKEVERKRELGERLLWQYVADYEGSRGQTGDIKMLVATQRSGTAADKVQLSVSGKNVKFTLIARRSRHYAGTRYLKRGVNEKGRVANDVETEQIVIEDVPDGCPIQISSVVQNRGSIPLFWSQETSRLNIKPDIKLSKKDENYEATRLHFENLVQRYGNPIIILNLIKTREKKPRETILRAEFSNAILTINRTLPKECRLSQSDDDCAPQNLSHREEDGENVETEIIDGSHEESANPCIKTPLLQKGVLRTNCIDCLDRTNVAQYCYGLVSLGRQLYTLGLVESPNINLYNPLAEDLMKMYETMGDTLALQYGGSAAHNKIFCERRGQWKAATHSQEFFRTLQRYYSNAYVDAEKQDAINVFLGYFQPQQGKANLWELGSDQHYNIGKHDPNFVDDNFRSFFKRSLSDGNIISESDDSSLASSKVGLNQSEKAQECNRGLSESSPEIPSCGSEICYSRYMPTISPQKLFFITEEDHYFEKDHIWCEEHGESCNCTNFIDLDWLSSSGNSCEEDMFDRSVASDSGSFKGREQTRTELHCDDVLFEYHESFANWVTNGEMLFR